MCLTNGNGIEIRLRKTHEFVHLFVRMRRALGGLGTDDKGLYKESQPLNDWILIEP